MAEATGLRNAALTYPVYGAPYGLTFPILDADGDLVTGAASLDSEVSLNGDTFADCSNEATEIATSSGMYYLLLTAAEMTADVVTVIVKTGTAGAKTTPVVLYPRKLPTIHSGTSAGGATGSITLDSAASAIDDFYIGCLVIGTLDSNVEARVITDYNGSTKVASVTPNWVTTPDSDDTFVIKMVEGFHAPFALAAMHLDHLMAVPYEANAKPGDQDALLNAMVQSDDGSPVVPRFTATALELAPSVSAASIADAVWDEDATGHQTQGTFGQAIGDPTSDSNTIYGAVVTGAAGATIAADIIDIEGKVDDLETRLGTPSDLGSGATVAANLVDIESQTDDIGVAGAGLTEAGGTGDHLTALGTAAELAKVPKSDGTVTWNATAAAQIQSEANDALVANHLDHLLAATYDPQSKPGDADALLNQLVEPDDGSPEIARFTATALEEAPTGGSAPTAGEIADAVWDEAQADHTTGGSFGEVATEVAAILVDTGTTLQGELDGIQADTEDIQSRLPAALVSGRIDASVGAMQSNVVTAASIATDAIDADALAADAVAEINATVDQALVDIHLDHLLAAEYDATAKPGDPDALLNVLVESDDGSPTTPRFTGTALEEAPAAEGGLTASAIADAVWDEARSGHGSAGSFGEGVNVEALNTQAKADVNAEADSAIETYHLDHLLANPYDASAKPGDPDALLNQMVESDDGSPTIARFTATSLEEAPTGGSAPTVGEIADAVWDEATVGHTTSGTFGEQLKTDVDAILEDTGTTLQAEVDGIQADTEDIQTRLPAALVGGRIDANAGAISGDAIAADTLELFAEALDQVTGQLDSGSLAAGTITAASIAGDAITGDKIAAGAMAKGDQVTGFNDLSAAQVNAEADTALSDYDPPTRTEATADKDEILTRLGSPAGASVSADIADVEGKVDDLETRLGTPSDLGSGATVAANLVDIESQTDDIGVAGAGLTEAGGTGDHLTAIPWNASWDVEVESEVADALEATIADSIPADGSRPSAKQALLIITRFLMERSVSGTTLTVKKEDGSSTSMTFTLSDALTPTSITRTT